MGNDKIMKMLAAIFALRAKYYSDKGWHQEAVAYEDAFEMLAYACSGRLNSLRQFGWSDEAEDILDNVGTNIDFWDLQEYINNLDKE